MYCVLHVGTTYMYNICVHTHVYWVYMYCIFVFLYLFLYFCIFVFLYFCTVCVYLFICIFVFLYFCMVYLFICIFVFLYFWKKYKQMMIFTDHLPQTIARIKRVKSRLLQKVAQKMRQILSHLLRLFAWYVRFLSEQ